MDECFFLYQLFSSSYLIVDRVSGCFPLPLATRESRRYEWIEDDWDGRRKERKERKNKLRRIGLGWVGLGWVGLG